MKNKCFISLHWCLWERSNVDTCMFTAKSLVYYCFQGKGKSIGISVTRNNILQCRKWPTTRSGAFMNFKGKIIRVDSHKWIKFLKTESNIYRVMTYLSNINICPYFFRYWKVTDFQFFPSILVSVTGLYLNHFIL